MPLRAKRSLTSRIIQGMLPARLIARENASHDARVFLLRTTPKGRADRALGREVSDRLEIVLTRSLSSQEPGQLNLLLERLGTWVSSEEYRAALETG